MESAQHIDPPAFTASFAEGYQRPFLFSFPHSGAHYPTDMVEHSPLSPLELRASEDAFVPDLYHHLNKQGAATIKANYARAYVDLNRNAEELDATMFKDFPSLPVRRTTMVRAGLGVIPRIIAQEKPIYRRRLQGFEATDRLNTIYHPYHQQLSQMIERLWLHHHQIYLLDCHSMPSIKDRKPKKAGRSPKLADIVLGDNWGSSSNHILSHMAEDAFRQAGFSVARNIPYAGGGITKRYGKPMRGVHVLQIEICRDLYMDEKTIEKLPEFNEIQQKITGAATQLMDALDTQLQCAAE